MNKIGITRIRLDSAVQILEKVKLPDYKTRGSSSYSSQTPWLGSRIKDGDILQNTFLQLKIKENLLRGSSYKNKTGIFDTKTDHPPLFLNQYKSAIESLQKMVSISVMETKNSCCTACANLEPLHHAISANLGIVTCFKGATLDLALPSTTFKPWEVTDIRNTQVAFASLQASTNMG
ncbi:hypothetical protein NPIL_83041 [Nephila pilipes]|uniref:Uncharacterized protein n=1 Tax=Nephila pilipes TaxID=299642 RepID=A0A8X6UD17_NEPPI|nr:hypothetical protein NPIL_83041 [Nephila pilipes]